MKNAIKILFIIFFLAGYISCSNNNEKSFAYGNFESEDLLIPSETTGIITGFYVDEGDLLEPGDRIAMTDTTQLFLKRTQLIAARNAVSAKLAQINSQIEVQKVNLQNLEREFKRFGSLFLEEAATKKQMDDLEGKIDMVKAQINALTSQKSSVYAELDAQDAQIEQVNDQIQSSAIVSPQNARVLETFNRRGEMAVAGRPIVKIADLSNLILRIFIDGNQLSSINIGDKVKVIYDGPDGLMDTEGTVSWISSEAEFTPKIIQTREERVNLVYAAKVMVPNDGSLKVGMPGEIQLLK